MMPAKKEAAPGVVGRKSDRERMSEFDMELTDLMVKYGDLSACQIQGVLASNVVSIGVFVHALPRKEADQ